jgi:general secretion pathway protein D
MRIFRLLLVSLVMVAAAFAAAQQEGQPFRLVFSNANLSSVLRAVGIRTGANIVYVGKEDPPVTVDVTAGNADEALRFVTTAASMTYRRVGQTFIVARAADMRQALEPFGLRFRMTLSNVSSADAAALLRASLPFLTVQPVGTDQLLLTGTKEDIEAAKTILENATATTTSIVPVRLVTPTKVVDVLSDMFPDVRFRAVSTGEIGGSLIMTGKADRVAEAKETLAMLDAENPVPGSEQIFQVYDIRYSSAPVLIAFLKQAMPDVVAIAGPENYSPASPSFRPLSSSSSTIADQGSGGGGAGGAGGGGGGGGTRVQSSNLPTMAGQNAGAGGSQTENRRMPGEMSTQIVMRGQKGRVDQAVAMLKSVDVKPKQVTVEVKVVDYSPNSNSNVGFSWNWSKFTFHEAASGSATSQDQTGGSLDSLTSAILPDPLTKAATFGAFSRVPWSWETILQAQVVSKEAKILATPSVQVIDNENANIFIGDTVRARITQAGALGAQSVQIVEFPIGIILLIRPRVNADGDVTMRVHPVVSTITSVDSDNVPQTSTREAETTVVVKNGETIVLGGLIRDEMTKTITEIPLLSKLPLIGELFKNTTRTGRKSEILVFITPKISDGTPSTSGK